MNWGALDKMAVKVLHLYYVKGIEVKTIIQRPLEQLASGVVDVERSQKLYGRSAKDARLGEWLNWSIFAV